MKLNSLLAVPAGAEEKFITKKTTESTLVKKMKIRMLRVEVKKYNEEFSY